MAPRQRIRSGARSGAAFLRSRRKRRRSWPRPATVLLVDALERVAKHHGQYAGACSRTFASISGRPCAKLGSGHLCGRRRGALVDVGKPDPGSESLVILRTAPAGRYDTSHLKAAEELLCPQPALVVMASLNATRRRMEVSCGRFHKGCSLSCLSEPAEGSHLDVGGRDRGGAAAAVAAGASSVELRRRVVRTSSA